MRPPYRSPHGPALKARGKVDLPRPIAAGLNLGEEHLDCIEQSHQRCVALGVSRIERPDLTPLGQSDLAIVRERNLRLHDHAAPVMEMLHEQIRASQSMVVLTDATGTVLHSIGDDDFLERASKVALRPGANWSESAKGTNAVGTALVQETPTLVYADEHFLHANHFLTCSAAPILDPRGNILGVLDVSGDYRSYHQHTMALVKMSARMIENRWLADDHRNVMRLHFHSRVEFIGTLMEGILAVSADGRIVGANRGALEQLGMSGAALRKYTLDTLLGTSVGALVDRFRSPLATPAPATMRTDGRPGSPAGERHFHLLARFNWPVWSHLAEAVSGVVATTPAAHAATPASTPATAPSARPAAANPGQALTRLRTGDPHFDGLIEKLRRIVDRGIPLLLVGESGSGRGTIARAFHDDSERGASPFVSLHCAGNAAASIEAELFGDVSAPGRIAQAAGGTLFLDEVGELPLPLQSRLLHALQERSLPAAAGAAGAAAIICSTRTNLADRVAEGRFNDDLYYRLNGLTLRLPPLRERGDLLVLVQRALEREGGGRKLELSPEVMAMLDKCRWPGNLRQLFNVLRAASVMLGAHETRIQPSHLPEDFIDETRPKLRVASSDTLPPASAPPVPARTLDDVQLETIRQVVDSCGGNISEAAKRLQVSRNTIYRKLRWRSA
jgi:transcriptional regulator of acetoin/glycerol metabolism